MKYPGLLLAFAFCSIGSVLSGSADRTLNLATFGASGSIQTMTCGVAAGSSTLTNCFGGDFAVGQTIRLPAVGVLPNSDATSQHAKTPGAPTVACVAQNGASCTGSVAYSYALASIQGRPNGAITPASSPGTITQAAQTPPAAPGQTTPGVHTHLSFAAVPTGQLSILYKGTNGGPLKFDTVLPGSSTSVDDYGHDIDWSLQSFTCSDLNVPCTAPSVATPNDVFARITAIHASSYTIGPETYPPKYPLSALYTGLGSADTYRSQPALTASNVTVYHDDTPAFQAIEHYIYAQSLTDAGHVTIFMPTGDYNVYAADQYGGPRAFTFVGMHNVTLEGAGWGTKIHQIGDRGGPYSSFIFSECGHDSMNAPGINSSSRCGDSGTPYNLMDPASVGAEAVTLATPAQASNFSPGEYVTITTKATVYPGYDNWELNKIRSANKRTGILRLQYPLTKTYSASPPLPYSECTTCAGAPQIYPMPHGTVATNITMRDFWFEGPVTFFDYNGFDGVTEENLYVHSIRFDSKNPGFVFHDTIVNNTIVNDGNGSSAEGSAGSAHIIFANNHVTDLGVASEQLCQESASDIVWTGNTIAVSGDLGTTLLEGAGCYGMVFTNNSISIRDSVLSGVFGFASPIIARVTGNSIRIDKMSIDQGGLEGPVIGNSVTTYDLGSLLNVWGNTWQIDNNLVGAPVTWGTRRAQITGKSEWLTK
jgi:hypothetical protein